MFASVALIGTAASGVLFGSVFLVPAAVAVGVMRPGGWGFVAGIRVALRRPRVFRRWWVQHSMCMFRMQVRPPRRGRAWWKASMWSPSQLHRSEEHTSELQSRGHLVCRLLLETTNQTHMNWLNG